jgi:integrase
MSDSPILQEKIGFFVKRPNGHRVTYSVIRRILPAGSNRYRHETVDHPALTAINLRHLEGKQNATATEAQLKDLLKQLKKDAGKLRPDVIHNTENQKIFAEFWEERFAYRDYADNASKRSVYNDYRRAVEILGNVSLVSGTESDVMKALSPLNPSKRKRVRSKLLQLFTYAGRKIKMPKPKKIHHAVPHLSATELEKVLAVKVKNPDDGQEREMMTEDMKLFYRALYWSGCRIGEAEFLKPEHFRGIYIDVLFQVTEEREVRPPKGNKQRRALIPPQGREIVKAWCEVDPERKRKLRQLRHNSVIRYACEKTFPNQVEKHCTPHDLRHSYAIQLLNDGQSLDAVSKSMGNTNKVCEMHYAGYVLTDSGLEAMEAVYGRKKS